MWCRPFAVLCNKSAVLQSCFLLCPQLWMACSWKLRHCGSYRPYGLALCSPVAVTPSIQWTLWAFLEIEKCSKVKRFELYRISDYNSSLTEFCEDLPLCGYSFKSSNFILVSVTLHTCIDSGVCALYA